MTMGSGHDSNVDSWAAEEQLAVSRKTWRLRRFGHGARFDEDFLNGDDEVTTTYDERSGKARARKATRRKRKQELALQGDNTNYRQRVWCVIWLGDVESRKTLHDLSASLF